MARDSVLERSLAKALGDELDRRRREAGLSQEALAEAAGISRNHYQLLESGLSDRAKNTPANPRLSTLLELARVLDCSVGQLVDDLSQRR